MSENLSNAQVSAVAEDVEDVAAEANDPVVPSVEWVVTGDLYSKLTETIRHLDPDVDEERLDEKAIQFMELAVQDWVRWVNNLNRDSRIDDMIVGRIGEIYADIIETVPSQEELVRLFQLKPAQAKKVSEIFTQSPTEKFKLRIYRALRAEFANAIRGEREAFSIEINKNLDAILKQEEEALHRIDGSFEYRESGKPLFSGASIAKVTYSTPESAEKMIRHFDRQITMLLAREGESEQ